jgi:hypothetical protein
MKNANLIERESVYFFSLNYSIISLKLSHLLIMLTK